MTSIFSSTVTNVVTDSDRGVLTRLLSQDAVAARQSAWQLEMEREQVQAWLNHSLLPGDTDSSSKQRAQEQWRNSSQRFGLFDTAARPKPAIAGSQGDSHTSEENAGASSNGGSFGANSENLINATDQTNANMENTTIASMGKPAASAMRFGAADRIVDVADEKLTESGVRLITIADSLQKLLSELAGPNVELLWNNKSVTLGNQIALSDDIDIATTEDESADESSSAASVSSDVATTIGSATDADDTGAERLRFHAESDGRNANVWIGADVSLALTETALLRLGSEIERLLGEQGMALQSLICNGIPVMRYGQQTSFRIRAGTNGGSTKHTAHTLVGIVTDGLLQSHPSS